VKLLVENPFNLWLKNFSLFGYSFNRLSAKIRLIGKTIKICESVAKKFQFNPDYFIPSTATFTFPFTFINAIIALFVNCIF